MKTTSSILTALALLASPPLFAQHDHKHEDTEAAAKQEAAKPYPLDTCIVSDEKLGEMGEPYVFVHEGQEIKLCCKSCKKKFTKDPAAYLKKLGEKK